jgi:UrcA family protein
LPKISSWEVAVRYSVVLSGKKLEFSLSEALGGKCSMDKTIFMRRGWRTALAGAALLFWGGQAVAADVSEVVVEAPRTVHHETVGRSRTTRAPIETITLSGRVSFGDLNLTKTADVATLRERVTAEARQACAELDRMRPLVDADPRCVQVATRNAMAQVDAKVAAAHK